MAVCVWLLCFCGRASCVCALLACSGTSRRLAPVLVVFLKSPPPYMCDDQRGCTEGAERTGRAERGCARGGVEVSDTSLTLTTTFLYVADSLLWQACTTPKPSHTTPLVLASWMVLIASYVESHAAIDPGNFPPKKYFSHFQFPTLPVIYQRFY